MKKEIMTRNKKALILLPSLEKGDGSAAAIMNYYDALAEEGWKVDFLLVRGTQKNRTQKITQNNGQIFVLPQKNKYSYTVTKMIMTVIKNGNYSVVHVNLPGHIAYCALKSAEKQGMPLRIFHCHNPKNTLNLKTKISTAIYDSLCLRHSNQLIACSKSAGLSRFGDRPFEILKNLVSVSAFKYDSKARTELRRKIKAENSIVVGVVGRITAQKNPLFLIECFEAFKRKEPRAKLLWIGEGELLEKVKISLKGKGLLNDCIFAGRKENVGKWYSAMDIFLLPSVFEGLGIVFLEAQCSGLLCFGSDKVPPETEVTGLMHRLPLKMSADDWAEFMQKEFNGIRVRQDMGDYVQKAGYTLETSGTDMLKLYNTWYKRWEMS